MSTAQEQLERRRRSASLEAGSVAVIDYDVPRGEWYFGQNAAYAMGARLTDAFARFGWCDMPVAWKVTVPPCCGVWAGSGQVRLWATL